MTRDRDQQPRRPASADAAFLEVTGALARDAAATGTAPPGSGRRRGDRERNRDQERAEPGEAAAEQPFHDDASGTGDSRGEHPSPAAAASGEDADRQADGPRGGTAASAPDSVSAEEVRDHLRRRAIFLRELAEARELRRRVTPHRSRRARIHAALRRRTFRIN